MQPYDLFSFFFSVRVQQQQGTTFVFFHIYLEVAGFVPTTTSTDQQVLQKKNITRKFSIITIKYSSFFIIILKLIIQEQIDSDVENRVCEWENIKELKKQMSTLYDPN